MESFLVWRYTVTCRRVLIYPLILCVKDYVAKIIIIVMNKSEEGIVSLLLPYEEISVEMMT